MATPNDRPLVCPRLVGRDGPVATIERLLDAAASRRGRVSLVAGEAGVGKSRLVAEARARAAARAFLAARLGALPVLLLLTYRTDEVAPALERLLAELDRGRLATELTLGPLDRDGVGAMLRAILQPEVPHAPFVDAIATLTDGNP